MSRQTTGSNTKHYAQRYSERLDRTGHGKLLHTLLWVFAVLLLAALVIISLLAQPIADDIWSLAYIPHQSALHYIHDFYLYQNGRVANATVMVLGIKIFGALAIKVTPILEIASLVTASAWLLWQFLDDTPRRLERAAMLGGAFTGVYLLVVPSTFDTLAWYTSSTVYVTSVIGIILIAAMYFYLYRRQAVSWYHYALLGLLVVLNQDFNEPAAILTCMIASLLLLYALVRKSKSNLVTATLWASSIVGLSIDYFSPATHKREEAQHAALHFHTVFISSLRDFRYTEQMLLSWRVALIAVLGMTFALALPALSKQVRKWLASIGLVLCMLPTYITALATHYANSAEGGITEVRTATVPFVFLLAGLLCLAIVITQSLPSRVRRWLPTVLYIAIPVYLVVSLQPVLNIIRAEILRDSLLRYREASIRAQVAAQQQTIYIIPAPILLNDSQAVDLAYNNHQTDWFVVALTDYYGLRGKTIKIARTPPAGYCLTHSDAAWWGAYTCQTDAIQQIPIQTISPATDVPVARRPY